MTLSKSLKSAKISIASGVRSGPHMSFTCLPIRNQESFGAVDALLSSCDEQNISIIIETSSMQFTKQKRDEEEVEAAAVPKKKVYHNGGQNVSCDRCTPGSAWLEIEALEYVALSRARIQSASETSFHRSVARNESSRKVS